VVSQLVPAVLGHARDRGTPLGRPTVTSPPTLQAQETLMYDASKDDLHLATATAASCQGLHPQADVPGISGPDQASRRLFGYGC
jgi:hypothetical protein